MHIDNIMISFCRVFTGELVSKHDIEKAYVRADDRN